MILLGISFALAGFLLIVLGFLANSAGRLEKHQMHGLSSLGKGLQVVAAVVGHYSTFMTFLSAAAAAYFGWLWWNGGGGDDTKRRLRSVWKPFVPVRRTAPAGAS
ncbi:hypothetical protein [Streptomyces lydicus]|uniref:hypothetical protein n=1 Tax=Streptomyces lydicus TaxID=47763 RepID=UPI0037918598